MPQVLRIGKGGEVGKVEVPEEELRAAGALPDPDDLEYSGATSGLLAEQDAELLAWLQAKESEYGPSIVARTIEGRDWYLKRLDDEEVTLILLLTPRTATGAVDFRDKSIWRPLRAAMLHVGLARGLHDERPLFSLDVARRFCASRTMTGLVLDLVNELAELNPGIIPNVPGAAVEELTPETPETTTPEAATPETDTPDSSTAARGSATPSLSLIGSDASLPTAEATPEYSAKSPPAGVATANSLENSAPLPE